MHQPPADTMPAPPRVPDASQARRSSEENGYADWLREHRPELAEAFAAALPGARAAVLSRLWGALAREPLPGIANAGTALAPDRDGYLTVAIAGRTVRGPVAAAQPFATAPDGLAVGGYTRPADLAAALWPRCPTFAAELDNSVANLALARASTAAAVATASNATTATAATAATRNADLVIAEQSIVDGHPLHPCCRTRAGMTVADVLAFAPEHRPTLAVPVIAVPPTRWHSTGTGLPPRLLAHPWQWQRLRHEHPDLVDTGVTIPADPLMSLRTLATPHGHVKTAVDVQMTSAVRTVSAAAVHNGPALSDLLIRLSRRTAGFAVLGEPAAGAVLVDGEPCPSLAVIHRAPPLLAPGECAAPLAALTAGRPRAADLIAEGYGDDPVAFLGHLGALLLAPLLILLDLGVALEAHGQNLLLVTAGGRARRMLYRDLGGVRVSPARLARHRIAAPPLLGDIPCDDPAVLRTKVLASAVATVLGELVTAVATRYGMEPGRLWGAVARAVPADLPGAAALMGTGTLPLKAMTAMRLAGSAADIWTTVPNPLAEHR